MAELADFMPPLDISTDELKKWGKFVAWRVKS